MLLKSRLYTATVLIGLLSLTTLGSAHGAGTQTPPSGYISCDNSKGSVGGLLYWDGSSIVKCIPNSSGDGAGNISLQGHIEFPNNIDGTNNPYAIIPPMNDPFEIGVPANSNAFIIQNAVNQQPFGGPLLVVNGLGSVNVPSGAVGIGTTATPDFTLTLATSAGSLSGWNWGKDISLNAGGALLWHGNANSNGNNFFMAYPSGGPPGYLFWGFTKSTDVAAQPYYILSVDGNDTALDYGQALFVNDVHAPNIDKMQAQINALCAANPGVCPK